MDLHTFGTAPLPLTVFLISGRHVAASTTPVGRRPLRLWNFFTAAFVIGP